MATKRHEVEGASPGSELLAFRNEHDLSNAGIATLLGEGVDGGDVGWWISHEFAAAGRLALRILRSLPATVIAAAVEPKLPKGAGLAAAKPDPSKKPASKKSTQTRKPTESEKLRHIAEKQAQK